ncbi:competence/damage-inducible protein A [Enterococcus sp. BWB1-3]|uniref:competence/damage-inducible protein A n=1 Tax=Enterococcus sp. BWB1-3 TaxID=2787713 RepID=UPI00192157B9|nr:competence/damage-inducible protein A [Enterococcus sp. BWB1-3]MBL1229901.1 competence/damage-inducible protein A [Enterococcus sp. BWB1-3]
MKAEIIAVGTELLLGQVVNTNATFLSEELADLGIEVYFHTVVGDNFQRLTEILDLADSRSDLVVLCGGLGPTDDDLTKDAVAAHIQHPLIQDKDGMKKLHSFFEFSRRQMTENNLKQALIIDGGTGIPNPTGLAVGSLVTKNDTSYLLMPGPPGELKPMFVQYVRPLLQKLFPAKEQLVSRVLRFYGIGESQLVTDLKELIDNQTNPTLAPYAKPNEVTLRLTANVSLDENGEALLSAMEKQIMEKVGDYFYGYGDENTLEETTVKLLAAHGKTVAAAESLTAGLFQSMIGNVSGASNVLIGGFVTYSPTMKRELLGIPQELLDEHGVVSEACAKAMAESTLKLTDADLAVSFTGVAGPDELEGQPAGTVWIGLAGKDRKTTAAVYHFNRDRQYIRCSAAMKGLDLIRRAVLNKN